jgi:hypothetical protein
MQQTLVKMAAEIVLSADETAQVRIDGLAIASMMDRAAFDRAVTESMLGSSDVRKYISVGYAKKTAWRQYWRTFVKALRAQVDNAPVELRRAVAAVAAQEFYAARAAGQSAKSKSTARHAAGVTVKRDSDSSFTATDGDDSDRAKDGETVDGKGKGNGNNRWLVGTYTPSAESDWFAWVTVVGTDTVTVIGDGYDAQYSARVTVGTDGKPNTQRAARRAHTFMAWVESSLGNPSAAKYVKLGINRKYTPNMTAEEIETVLDAASLVGANAYKWFRVPALVTVDDTQD